MINNAFGQRRCIEPATTHLASDEVSSQRQLGGPAVAPWPSRAHRACSSKNTHIPAGTQASPRPRASPHTLGKSYTGISPMTSDLTGRLRKASCARPVDVRIYRVFSPSRFLWYLLILYLATQVHRTFYTASDTKKHDSCSACHITRRSRTGFHLLSTCIHHHHLNKERPAAYRCPRGCFSPARGAPNAGRHGTH